MDSQSRDKLFISFVVGGKPYTILRTSIDNFRVSKTRFNILLQAHDKVVAVNASISALDAQISPGQPPPKKVQKEWIFNRDPDAFEDILEYIQTGTFHKRPTTCDEQMKQELAYWMVDIPPGEQICPCVKDVVPKEVCYSSYASQTPDKDKLLETMLLSRGFKHYLCDPDNTTKEKIDWLRKRMYRIIESRDDSILGKIFFAVSFLMIAINMLIIILDSLPGLQWSQKIDGLGRVVPDNATTNSVMRYRFPDTKSIPTSSAYTLWIIDWLCTVWFIVEISLRIFSVPHWKLLVQDLMFYVDVLAIIPSFLAIAIADSLKSKTINIGNMDYTNMEKAFQKVLLLRGYCVCASFLRLDGYSQYHEIQPCKRIDSKPITTQLAYALWSIDWVCTVWFIIELVLTVATVPTLKKLTHNYMFYLDFLAILPSFLNMVVAASSDPNTPSAASAGVKALKLFRALRAIRIVRVVKLAKMHDSFRILTIVIRQIWQDIVLFILYLCVATIIFATLLYYIEDGVPDTDYFNIPNGVFWAIASYFSFSDAVPKSSLARLVSGFGAAIGIMIMALPITFIIQGFGEAFKQFKKEQEAEKATKGICNELQDLSVTWSSSALGISRRRSSTVSARQKRLERRRSLEPSGEDRLPVPVQKSSKWDRRLHTRLRKFSKRF